MIELSPTVSARFRLLITRAALPAWILGALALIADAKDIFGVIGDGLRIVRSIPAIAWLLSPVGLLVLAVGWLIWLLIRPPGRLQELERVERVRGLLREVAAAIGADAEEADAASKKGELSSGYIFMQAFDFLDDACVAAVMIAYNAFREREERMYKAAHVPYDGVHEAAAYLDRLAAHLQGADIDPGFRVPESFAEWCKEHKPNTSASPTGSVQGCNVAIIAGDSGRRREGLPRSTAGAVTLGGPIRPTRGSLQAAGPPEPVQDSSRERDSAVRKRVVRWPPVGRKAGRVWSAERRDQCFMLAPIGGSKKEDAPFPERRRVREDVPALGIRLNLGDQRGAAALGPVRATRRGEPGVFDHSRRLRRGVAQQAPPARTCINEIKRAHAEDPRVASRGEKSEPAAHTVPHQRDARGIDLIAVGGER